MRLQETLSGVVPNVSYIMRDIPQNREHFVQASFTDRKFQLANKVTKLSKFDFKERGFFYNKTFLVNFLHMVS